MQYNLSSPYDRERFTAKAKALTEKGGIVDLTEKTLRTINQNSYLHLIIGALAIEVGVSLEYAKQEYFKRLVNPDIFVEKREDKLQGKVVDMLRSTAIVPKEQMSVAIDRFKNWARENNIFLPNPGDKGLLAAIQFEMSRNQTYL